MMTGTDPVAILVNVMINDLEPMQPIAHSVLDIFGSLRLDSA